MLHQAVVQAPVAAEQIQIDLITLTVPETEKHYIWSNHYGIHSIRHIPYLITTQPLDDMTEMILDSAPSHFRTNFLLIGLLLPEDTKSQKLHQSINS